MGPRAAPGSAARPPRSANTMDAWASGDTEGSRNSERLSLLERFVSGSVTLQGPQVSCSQSICVICSLHSSDHGDNLSQTPNCGTGLGPQGSKWKFHGRGVGEVVPVSTGANSGCGLAELWKDFPSFHITVIFSFGATEMKAGDKFSRKWPPISKPGKEAERLTAFF